MTDKVSTQKITAVVTAPVSTTAIYNSHIKARAPKYDRFYFKFWLYYLGSVRPWTNWLVSLSLSFLISKMKIINHLSSVQLLSRVRLFATPWIAAHQASLSIANSRSLLKLISIESVMPSNHLILCRPLLLLPSIFPSISVFSNESVLSIRWPKYWSFSVRIILPMNIQDWFPLGWAGWISLPSKGLSGVFSKTTVQKHQFFSAQLS